MAEISNTFETNMRAFVDQSIFNARAIVDEALVDAIWQDLDSLVSRDRIRQVASEVAAAYQGASVTSFVPIFVRRRTKEIFLSRRK